MIVISLVAWGGEDGSWEQEVESEESLSVSSVWGKSGSSCLVGRRG